MSIKLRDTTSKWILDFDEAGNSLVITKFNPATFSKSEGDWLYSQAEQYEYAPQVPNSNTPLMPLQDVVGGAGPQKATIPLAGGYGTTFGLGMAADTVVFMPFRETPGFTLDNLSMGVWTAGTGMAKLAVYTSKRETSYGYEQLMPGTPYEIGEISVATTGQKDIININLSLPPSENGIYWFAFMPQNSGGFLSIWSSSIVVFPEWMSGSQFGGAFYRNLSYKTTGAVSPSYSFPSNLSPADIAGVTGDCMAITYGVA